MNEALKHLKNSNTRIKGYETALKAIKDPEMRAFVDSLWVLTAKRGLYYLSAKRYASNLKFSKLVSNLTFSDITWEFVCKVVSKDLAMGYYCCFLMYKLLNEDIYSGEYKEKLLEMKDIMFLIPQRGIQERYYATRFCRDDLKYLLKIDAYIRQFYFIRTDNNDLWAILAAFCEKDKNTQGRGTTAATREWFFNHADTIFQDDEESLHQIADFSYASFMHQLSRCMHAPRSVEMICMLQRLYAFLIEHPSGEGANIFTEYDDMDLTALKRDDFAKRIMDGFSFIYYNPHADVPASDKWILHINGHERGSTKSKATSTKTYDFTKIDSTFYRQLAKQFYWNEDRSNFNSKYERFTTLVPMINKLTAFKKKEHSDEALITIDETHFIRLWMQNTSGSVSVRNSKLQELKRFLEAMVSNGSIEAELLALSYLKQLATPHNKDAKSIPEEHVEAINNVMLAHSDESLEKSYCYVIFHILIQTEFRLSQVCHLETGCVVPTMNRNQFIITESKTSHGQKYQPIITDFTKELIDDAEKISAPAREACITPGNEKYLFLYKTKENQYVPISGPYFRVYLAQCCDEAGIPRYTPSNIRDFHMTKAQEMILRKGYSNATLSILSGHRHVDVTNNHYIEDDLTRIFEAMYGVVIGDVTIEGQIVNAIPKELDDKKHTVEGGCGKCSNKVCIVDSLISCLMCKDFVTAIEYLEEFKKLADYLDSCIAKVSLPHDKEDLVNKKRLVVAYIIKMETMIYEATDDGE